MNIPEKKEPLRKYVLRITMEEISVGKGQDPYWMATLERFTHNEIIKVIATDKFASMAVEKALDEYNDKVPIEEIIL